MNHLNQPLCTLDFETAFDSEIPDFDNCVGWDFPELDYELSEEEILWLETHKSEPEPEGYYNGSHCYG